MIYPVYIAHDGLPKTGLSPDWENLVTLTNATDKSGSAPAIIEVGGGWYKFTIVYGAGAWNVSAEDLVGVIDADPDGTKGLSDVERYIPVELTKRALALAAITNDLASETAIANVNVSKWRNETPDGLASGLVDVNVKSINGTAQTANDNGADINAILVDTGTTIQELVTTIDAIVATIVEDTGTTLPATLVTLVTGLTDIKGTTFVKDTHSLPQCISSSGNKAVPVIG